MDNEKQKYWYKFGGWIKALTMDTEKLKIWIELGKWFVGAVTIFASTWVIDAGFKSREAGLKELTLYDKYVNLIVENDKLGASRKLSKFFATVTTSKEIRDRWYEYYVIVDKEFNDTLKKYERDKAEMKSIDTVKIPTKEQEQRKQKLLENIVETQKQLNTEIKPADKTGELGNARLWEEKGFDYLLKKDIENAILSFSKSENAYPSYHQVYEIKNYISKQSEKSGKDISETLWKDIYKTILDKYGWGMPQLYKDEFNKLIK